MIFVIFSDFPNCWEKKIIMKKKFNLIIMKNEKKKLVHKMWVGLLPNCIARAGGIVL